MKNLTWVLALGITSMMTGLIASCGKSETVATCDLTSTLCSCDRRTTSAASCDDYEGSNTTDAPGKCDSGGTYSSTALCPTSGRVGTCKITVASLKTYKRYYSSAATNQTACLATSISTGYTGSVEWIAN